MKYKVIFIFVILTCSVVVGQHHQKAKSGCFIIPNKAALTVVDQQPQSPIEFVKTQIVRFLDGGSTGVYQIRNRSAKPIRAYTIATVTSMGTWNETNFIVKRKKNYFRPMTFRPSSLKEWGLEIIPLTKELEEKHKVSEAMQAMIIFMVVRVEFADGSSYSAESEYESLKTFFEKNAIDPNDTDRREKR